MIEMGDHEGAQRLLANLQVYSYSRVHRVFSKGRSSQQKISQFEPTLKSNLFLGCNFSMFFFSIIWTRSTSMKYWMVKILDLEGVGLIRPFENTLYISWFVLFYPDFYHNLLPSSGHDPVREQAAAGPQQEAHPHHERAAGVQTGRRHQLSEGLHQRLEAQQVQCIVMCRNVQGPS